MASLGADGDFTGKLRLPLPDTFSGQPADWEEWAWNFKAYISMFETGAVALLDRAEMMNDELTDETLQVILDTGDVDQDATAARVLFSRKLHYLLSQLVKDSAKLVVRQNEDSNGFETWRWLYAKFALPDATRSTSLLTQLLDFRFNPSTFEQDFNVWETIKTKYERQSGQALPDGVLVATLLNKTTGALQQHLRLNARALQTYAQVREVILEYHRSRLLMNPVAQTSANATFQGGTSAPMDIGALKGKGKKGKGKGKSPHWNFMKGKGKKGKGKGKGKDFAKGKKGKGKSKGKKGSGLSGSSSSSATCWTCGSTGHFSSNCPHNWRVSAVQEEELSYQDEADWSAFEESTEDWSEWTVGALYEDSWDASWDDGSLWSSWDSWDSSWDSWDWSSDFQFWAPEAQPAATAKQETLPRPSEAPAAPKAMTLSPPQASVSAVTLSSPPGLSQRPKPKAKSSLSSSTFLMSAVVLSNFGIGSSMSFDGMMNGTVEFNFGGPVSASPGVQMAPLETFSLNGRCPEHHTLLSVSDLGFSGLKTTFKDVALEEHLVATTLEDAEPWILFDSGAATHCCPRDFASDWPLLPLTGKPPPLRSISGQPLTVYGRRLVKVDFEGQPCFLHFYVCDVPYCVVSVGRLLRSGFEVKLTAESQTLSTPEGQCVPVIKHGSLLFLRPTMLPFEREEFESVCNFFHEAHSHGTLVAPTFHTPVYYHTDTWELSGNTLTRIHKRTRATFFSPEGTKDRPVELSDLADTRATYLEYADGRKETLTDNWRSAEFPRGKTSERFVGKTVFQLASKPTGRKLVGKQTTIPEPATLKPQPQPVSEEPQPLFKQPSKETKEHSVEDTFRLRLAQTASGSLSDFQKSLLEQLSEKDPTTGQPYTHDLWLDFPACWVRVHYLPRDTLFVPEEPHFMEQLGNGRMTLVVRPETADAPFWHTDRWREDGATLISSPFVGATCFDKVELSVEQVEPEAAEYVAQRPKALKQPSEPTLTERLEHELTHLPFRPWCDVCVRSKSRQSKSRKLSMKQPVLQMDRSFLGDSTHAKEQITILNVVDVLTNMALSVVIPTKARTPYSQAELRRFVLETGRTFGILQCDPEPALKALAASVTGEVGGLSLRQTPVGWKQAQGTVGNMQATLYGQIKALRLEIEKRYGVELSVHSALFTWVVRHAQWLINRYLCNAEGTPAFERRWGKRYAGFLCRFGETVLFRKPHTVKGQPAFIPGIWLGKDTESDQHFCADGSGVFKARTVKRFPPSKQCDLLLLQAVKARPWDPLGAKHETDSFVFPTSRSEEANKPPSPLSQPLSQSDLVEVEQALGEEALQEDLGLDLPDLATEVFGPDSASEVFEPPLMEEQGTSGQARSSSDAAFPEPAATRPRLEEAPSSPTKRAAETFPVGSSKVQRMASVTLVNTRKKFPICDLRIASVTTKHELEVPVHINQDEKELLLMKTLENPQLWQHSEFPEKEEKAAMTKEMKSMQHFGVFEEVDVDKVPAELLDKAISTRWVKVRKTDGTLRTRLVVRGYTQEVADKDETFASTPSLTTLRLLLTLAVAKGWSVSTGDISTAFLHANVEGDFYVIPPLEFYPEGKTLWRLRKALYGLKHSPKLWQSHFASVMEKNNFRRMKSDPNLYVHNTKQLYVLAYVDDLMFFGSEVDVSALVQDLQKDLLLKMTGTLNENQSVIFLGRNLKRTSTFISVGMSPAYIDNMLELYGLEQCRSSLAPGTDTLRKQLDSEPLSAEDHKRFRRVVGQLLWLSSVRPDIMFATKELSRGLSSPTSQHESKAKHLLRYLSGTRDFAQRLQPTLSLSPQHKAIDVNIFVDSDWAGCHDTRRSTSGVSLFVLGANILSHSRTQATVALSSGEAELYAIGSGTADALFIKSLVEESAIFQRANLCVFTDSNVGKSIASRFGASRKTKHVELRFLYVQELISSGMVRIKKILGTLSPADILTKYVPKETLQRHLPTFGFDV